MLEGGAPVLAGICVVVEELVEVLVTTVVPTETVPDAAVVPAPVPVEAVVPVEA